MFETKNPNGNTPFRLAGLSDLRFFETDVQRNAFDAVVDIGESVEKRLEKFRKSLAGKHKGQ